MEHRSVQRFRISVPITFYWGNNNLFKKGDGTSRDISTQGVFIVSEERVLKGSDVWLRFTVPPIRKGGKASEMQGFGRIVRVQKDGFAAQATIKFPNHASGNNREVAKPPFPDEQNEPECVACAGPSREWE